MYWSQCLHWIISEHLLWKLIKLICSRFFFFRKRTLVSLFHHSPFHDRFDIGEKNKIESLTRLLDGHDLIWFKLASTTDSTTAVLYTFQLLQDWFCYFLKNCHYTRHWDSHGYGVCAYMYVTTDVCMRIRKNEYVRERGNLTHQRDYTD